jgi:hypothetical protein
MLAALFPTLLAVYTVLALWTAKSLVDSYDRVTTDPDVRAGFTHLASPARVGVVIGFAVLWPLTWAVVLLSNLVLVVEATRSARGK